MKKSIVAMVLSFILLLSLTLSPSAEGTTDTTTVDENGNTVIYYDDGSYTLITPAKAVPTAMTRAAVHETAGEVSAINYAKDGDQNWKYTLIGYFTYEEGVSCVCTNSTYEVSITGSGWKFYDPSNTWSDNAAYGYGVFKHKFAFITNNTTTVDLRIRCDNYGNFY